MTDFNTYQPAKSSGPSVTQIIIIALLSANLAVVGAGVYYVNKGIETVKQVAGDAVELTKDLPKVLDRVEKNMARAEKQIEDVKKTLTVGFDKIPTLSKDTAKGWIDGIRDGLNNDPAKK